VYNSYGYVEIILIVWL